MANKAKGFVVKAGKRASGSPYWKVSGTLHGRQIRRQFDDRLAAMAFAEQNNSELFGTRAPQGQLLTHLAPSQVRAAEAVYAQLARDFPGVDLLDVLDYYRAVSRALPADTARRIAPAIERLEARYPTADLALACDWFVTNYRPAKHAITLKVALEHYLADVNRRHETRVLSKPQFLRIGYAMSDLEKHFGSEEQIGNFTTGRLQDYLKETTKGRGEHGYTNKTWNNRRGFLTTFFEFCRQEQWLESNPASGIRNFRKKELPASTPTVLTAKRAKDLMEHLETFKGGRLVPFYALALFAGIRPDYLHGEIKKLKPEHFDLKAGELKLPAEITKTRRARLVKLQPNLLRWLKAYPFDRFPIISANFKKLHIKTRQTYKLEHDVLRHTYCSMLVAKFRSVADASLQAGNSENVIWSNYLNLVSQKEAAAFWSIKPKIVHPVFSPAGDSSLSKSA